MCGLLGWWLAETPHREGLTDKTKQNKKTVLHCVRRVWNKI